MNGLEHHEGYDHAPIVHLLNSILHTAIDARASDIHCEPQEGIGLVRFRIDGSLHESQRIDILFMHQLIARIKVMSHIDIAQSRIPHDGKFRLNYGKKVIDCRVSTFPSLHGENCVIRILDREAQTIALNALGLTRQMYERLVELIAKPQGFLLVSGPTGSGKTTTMYAALALLNKPDAHIITLEDPVEYNLTGVTQSQIFPDAGFTFAKGMRSLLRQDPDVVMVGEVRDKETAQIALEASLTGHMVMSSVHAHDAPSVVMRLIEMGVEPFLIAASLTGVLAQRLIRKLCEGCKVSYAPRDDEKALLEKYNVTLDLLYTSSGCTSCKGTGHKGRIGIFQLLTVTPALRALLVHHPRIDDIGAQAQRDGMQPLILDGIEKVRAGLVSLRELIGVIGK